MVEKHILFRGVACIEKQMLTFPCAPVMMSHLMLVPSAERSADGPLRAPPKTVLKVAIVLNNSARRQSSRWLIHQMPLMKRWLSEYVRSQHVVISNGKQSINSTRKPELMSLWHLCAACMGWLESASKQATTRGSGAGSLPMLKCLRGSEGLYLHGYSAFRAFVLVVVGSDTHNRHLERDKKMMHLSCAWWRWYLMMMMTFRVTRFLSEQLSFVGIMIIHNSPFVSRMESEWWLQCFDCKLIVFIRRT